MKSFVRNYHKHNEKKPNKYLVPILGLDYFHESQYLIQENRKQRIDISGDTQVNKSQQLSKKNKRHMSRSYRGR